MLRILLLSLFSIMSYSIANGQIELLQSPTNELQASFLRSGTRLNLQALSNTVTGTNIAYVTEGSSWEITIRNRNNPSTSISISDTDASLSLNIVNIGSDLLGQWHGQLQLGSESFALDVWVGWSLSSSSSFLEGNIWVNITQTTNLYLSAINFPIVSMTTIGDDPTHDHQRLVVPVLTGLLIDNPAKPGATPLPPLLSNPVFSSLNIPTLGYYNEQSSDLFTLADNDVDRWWKLYRVDNQDNQLTMQASHVPDNIYQTTSFALPYNMRLRASHGDWVTAAEEYRAHMEGPDISSDWYHGPIGASTNPAPLAMKNLVAHSTHQTPTRGDMLDSSKADAWNIYRVFGEGVFDIWFDAHFPDTFESFYYCGYLPGRPSFPAAVQEAQDLPGYVVAPYVQSSAAISELAGNPLPNSIVSTCSPQPGDPIFQVRSDIDDSLIRDEFGNFIQATVDGSMYFMCNGAAKWSDVFVDNVAAIASTTTCQGAYLDFFGATICYEPFDDGDGHQHFPGGGNYMYVGRTNQLQDLQSRVGSFGLSSESPHSFLSDQIHLSYLPPTRFALTKLGAPLDSATASTIPFFRTCHPNIKLSEIGSPPSTETDDGRLAWLAAVSSIGFGQLPNQYQPFTDHSPSFHAREDARYFAFLRDLAGFLRVFLPYHNGTMRRSPSNLVVTAPPGFAGLTTAASGSVKPYRQDPLVVGMYQSATAPSLALAAVNPWIGQTQATIDIDFTFDPNDYGLGVPYDVSLVDASGNETVIAQGLTGSFSPGSGFSVGPGEMLYWMFD